MTNPQPRVYLRYMSKYAVLILPFFIVSLVTVGPLINKSSADVDSIVGSPNPTLVNRQFNQTEGVELLAQNYPGTIASSDNSVETPEVSSMEVVITAYSSTPGQTDNTPFITASGSYVRSGVVAANFLPFGTKIKLPEIFGDRIFTVEDRTHEKYNDRVDIWFPSKAEAIKFGSKISEIEIL